MNLNSAKRKMLAGEPAIGAGVCFGSPLIAEMFALAGYDFVLVDNQHGVWDLDRCMAAFRAIRVGNSVPMARVEQNDFFAIGSVLDCGALGIVIPMVNSRQDAEAAVFSAYYPPLGGRSQGGLGTALYASDPHVMNEALFLAVQIETAEAVENAEEILSVAGIDGCWIGPADLANSLGIDLGSGPGRKQHEDNIKRVLDVCHKMGKIPGIASGRDAKRRIEAGFRFVTAIGDGSAIRESARSVLENLQSISDHHHRVQNIGEEGERL